MRVPELPLAVGEGIEQPDVATGEVLGVARQRRACGRAVHDGAVVERRGAREEAVVLPLKGELGRDLERLAEGVALLVVQVAVVDVRGTPGTALAGADQCRIGIGEPPRLSVRDRGVPVAGDRPVRALEVERTGRPCGGQCRDCQACLDGAAEDLMRARRLSFHSRSPWLAEGRLAAASLAPSRRTLATCTPVRVMGTVDACCVITERAAEHCGRGPEV